MPLRRMRSEREATDPLAFPHEGEPDKGKHENNEETATRPMRVHAPFVHINRCLLGLLLAL